VNPIQLLKQDHRHVKALFRKFENQSRTAEKQKLGQEIIEELSIHAAIEEHLIYPLLREQGERAEESVLNALEEHHAVKTILAELDGMNADHERYDAKMHVVRESVESHIEEEEAKLLPRLDAMLGNDDRKMLAESMLELKPAVPNHPHPNAPDAPPGVMSGMLALVADTGKDVVRRLINSEKAAGHRRVTRRADAAIERARRPRRAKTTTRGPRKRTARKKSATRRGARKARSRRTTRSRTTRGSSKSRR
jgi:hemerythrin-like domain-containing protein